MEYKPVIVDGYEYIMTNEGKETILLLHGLFGNMSNFKGILTEFGLKYNVVIPILPIFSIPLRELGLDSIGEFIAKFIEKMDLKNMHILGNSLGGHLAQLYALQYPEMIKSLTLTGSSGLYESAFGTSFPKRGNYEFIKDKVSSTFYNPEVATKEMVDEVFNTVNDTNRALRIVVTAKSAVRSNLEDKINKIIVPTLLVWGNQDIITPPFVGEKFNELIPNSRLVMLDKCGHAPMMEKPQEFNMVLEAFLKDISSDPKV